MWAISSQGVSDRLRIVAATQRNVLSAPTLEVRFMKPSRPLHGAKARR
jgi:hypothetical protein